MFSAFSELLGAGAADGHPAGNPFVSERERWRAGRPSLPLTLWFALGAWLGIAASYANLRDQGIFACQVLAVLSAALLVVCIICLLASIGRAACVVMAAGILLGLMGGCAQAGAVHTAQESLWGTGGEAVVELTQDGRTGSFGQTVTGRMQMSAGTTALVRVNLTDAPTLMAGQRVSVRTTWREPSSSAAESLWTRGIAATANASGCTVLETSGPAAAIRAFRAQAIAVMESLHPLDMQLRQAAAGEADEATASHSSDGRDFLEAVLLGWRDGIFDADWYAAAKVDGVAHMVAVSGAHLAIVCGIVLALLRRLRVSRTLQLAIQLVLVAAYLVLTGVAVSAVRAAFMTIIGLSAFLAKRRAYSLGALSFAIIVMLALDPLCAFSLSFALSAGSTLGIVLFARYISDWMAVLLGRVHAGAIVQSVALCLAAQLVSSPLSAAEFGQVSLVSPVVNVLMGPLFTVICGVGLPLVVLATACGVGAGALSLLAAACSWVCALLQTFAALPGAAVPVYLDPAASLGLAVGLPAMLWAVWPRPSWHLVGAIAAGGTAVALALTLSASLKGDEVVMLDVGQGDAFVLQSEGRTLLIDTGNHDDLLLQGLARQGIRHLDAVAVTHADDDHCGSLSALKGVVGVDCVLLANEMLTCENAKAQNLVRTAEDVAGAADAVKGVSVGERIVLGRFALDVIGPDSFTEDGGNADSLTLLLQADDDADGTVDWRGLFCGDAENDQIHAYQEQGRIGDIDIYKVGHHGSRAALDEAAAETMRPEICLVSVGAHNRYGHPAASTLETLRQVGGTIWRTDQQGDVTCHLSPERIRVTAQRAS
ncbi:MAG: DNA internalization-related competence protein ComEC/Rec2 [Eggerthellaceae bacterium]